MWGRDAPERGVGLIAAIFVIVILALLGTALIRLLTTEQASTNRAFASTQAFFAAETAVQWGLYQVIAQNHSSTMPNGGDVFDGDAPTGLAHCDQDTHARDPQNFGTALTTSTASQALYRFKVEGECYPDTAEEARRTLEVRFWQWE